MLPHFGSCTFHALPYIKLNNFDLLVFSFSFTNTLDKTQLEGHNISFSHSFTAQLLIMLGLNILPALLAILPLCHSVIATDLIVKRTGPVRLPSCVDYTPFVYSGCFTDNGDPRTLLYKSNLDFDSMTVEKCVAFCKGELTLPYTLAYTNIEQAMATDMLVWNTTASAGAGPLSVDLSSMNRAANLDVLAIPRKLVAATKQSRSIRILHSR